MLERDEFNKKYNYFSHTPMIKQYLDVKFEHQDSLVLFRMGDFFELFFDDAVKVSKLLSIALTKRAIGEEGHVAMCGVPHHALDNYMQKLLESGEKIAICDQKESPEEAKKRGGYKAIVKREVIRIITPGTIFEDDILDSKKNNYLMSIFENKEEIAFCYVDISTSNFYVSSCVIENFSSEIAKISPREILLPQKMISNERLKDILKPYYLNLVYQPDHIFDFTKSIRVIENIFKIKSYESIGIKSKNQISSIGAILQYLSLTQKENIPNLPHPKYVDVNHYMIIDPSSRRSLEITSNLKGERNNSLLDVIDKTVTKGGARLLYSYLSNPLANINKINKRLEVTNFFFNNIEIALKIRSYLEKLPDIERIISKVGINRATIWDIVSLRNGLVEIYDLREELYKDLGIRNIPQIIEKLVLESLKFDSSILEKLFDAISDDPPNNLSEIGVIRKGYNKKLDEICDIITDSKSYINKLKEKYQKITGVDNLKISTNNVIGMYIEVTSKNLDKIPHDIFIHRQTTANSARFITEELKDLESKIITANSSLSSIQQEIFSEICGFIIDYIDSFRILAIAINQLDVFTNFAFFAKENNYVIPSISDGIDFEIENGRHPIVEESLKKEHAEFVPNNCFLNESARIWIVTGPNMGGKSTFLRQNAIIAILAQIGSFVPAKKCKIGIIDKIFSRVGAGDELSRGHSTFMVEMVETASILNQATLNSLIILDEVGRGTSTFDGMAIARSVVEYIHNKLKARCLFATHYHELTDLSINLISLRNYTVSVKELNNEIIFLHKIKDGTADKSYGIHVANLAGIPYEVILRARDLLKKLEKSSEAKNIKKISDESSNLNIFDIQDEIQNQKIEENKNTKIVIDELISVNTDEITPKEALNILEKLKELLMK